MTALHWYYGPMSAGKSTLALQIDHNYTHSGRSGLRVTRLDRSGTGVISARVGMTASAIEADQDTDLHDLATATIHEHGDLSYMIVDEAQFLTPAQVDQLGRVVDEYGVEVCAFGLATDFRSEMFPGSKRLFEIADRHHPLQLPVMCWCGSPARMNARVVGDTMVTEGDQVVLGDTAPDTSVHYVLLCRYHYRRGEHVPAIAATPGRAA